jgi:hypothetical protein
MLLGMAPTRLDAEPDPLDAEPGKRVLLGTIELIAVLVVALALIAFVVWFLFFAHNPLLRS